MDWTVELDTDAVKQLKKLDKQTQKRIVAFLQKRIKHSQSPRYIGKALNGNLSGFWRYRVGDYRLICKIKDHEVVVLVVHISHRKNIYKN